MYVYVDILSQYTILKYFFTLYFVDKGNLVYLRYMYLNVGYI